MLAPPTVAELATFTGRPVNTYSGFAAQALAQATLMFQVVTKLEDYPEDPQLLQLAMNAILEMADRLVLEQPFAEVSTRPFQSETIGSYTYSRSTATAAKVQNGSKTGLFWWDVAVDELAMPGALITAHGSIKVDNSGDLRVGQDRQLHVVSPAEDADWPPYVRIS